MRLVIQRVGKASVEVDGEITGKIGKGLLVLLGVTHSDDESVIPWLVRKTCELRIFEDEQGKMNRSLLDVGGKMLVVSQFTLYARCLKGRRPDFNDAAPPQKAEALYEKFVEAVREAGVHVETGVFGAYMKVDLTNDGPVTIILEKDTTELNQ